MLVKANGSIKPIMHKNIKKKTNYSRKICLNKKAKHAQGILQIAPQYLLKCVQPPCGYHTLTGQVWYHKLTSQYRKC